MVGFVDSYYWKQLYLLRDKRPELVQVYSRLVEVGVVGVHVEVPHTNLNNKCHIGIQGFFSSCDGWVGNLSEVSRMVLVKVDPVVMLPTSVSATSRVLPVLSDPGKLDQNQNIPHVKIWYHIKDSKGCMGSINIKHCCWSFWYRGLQRNCKPPFERPGNFARLAPGCSMSTTAWY